MSECIRPRTYCKFCGRVTGELLVEGECAWCRDAYDRGRRDHGATSDPDDRDLPILPHLSAHENRERVREVVEAAFALTPGQRIARDMRARGETIAAIAAALRVPYERARQLTKQAYAKMGMTSTRGRTK